MTFPGPDGAPIYLDYNATTPVDPRVAEAMRPALGEYFGNPSSGHVYGRGAQQAVELARAQVMAGIGATSGRLIFTGSGSEADALAVRGVLLRQIGAGPGRWRDQRPHVITQATEHPAVLSACEYLIRLHGAEVTVLGVDETGQVDPEHLRAAMTDRTMLVSIMHANNETGTLQRIAELAAITHEYVDARFHTDAAQSVGKVGLDVESLGVDLLTIVGHKLYGPKGVGALWVRDGVRLEPIVGGGGQEGGDRAGTENVAGIVGLGAAVELACTSVDAEAQRLTALRDRLQAALETALPERVTLNGHPTHRLPQTLNVSIDGAEARALLAEASGIAASAGSACHAGLTTPSTVLLAMGIDDARALSAIRLSLGRWSSEADVDRAAEIIADAVGRVPAPATEPEPDPELLRRQARTLPVLGMPPA